MRPVSDATPWQNLPIHAVERLRAVLPELVDEMIATIQAEVPQYSRPMEGRFGEGVKRGVGVALDRFFALPGTREPALTEESRRVYLGLGRGEVRMGRSLESLLAAYRTGARVCFHRFAHEAVAAGEPTEVVVALGESIFAYIDEVSAASVEGYAAEQSDRASDLDRRRAEIAAILLAGGGDELTLTRLASLAGWRLPAEVRLAVVPLEHSDGLRLALGPEALTLVRATEVVCVLPAHQPRAAVDRALTGRSGVVGPVRAWAQAPESLRLALALRVRVGTGSTDAEPGPAWVEDHLLDIVLHAEPGALADLTAHRLAPLDAERPASRERLAETLLAWLAHDGHRAAIGRELHIHPQTVGYRVGRLRELFGEALDDPQVRFELELVLRAGTSPT